MQEMKGAMSENESMPSKWQQFIYFVFSSTQKIIRGPKQDLLNRGARLKGVRNSNCPRAAEIIVLPAKRPCNQRAQSLYAHSHFVCLFI